MLWWASIGRRQFYDEVLREFDVLFLVAEMLRRVQGHFSQFQVLTGSEHSTVLLYFIDSHNFAAASNTTACVGGRYIFSERIARHLQSAGESCESKANILNCIFKNIWIVVHVAELNEESRPDGINLSGTR